VDAQDASPPAVAQTLGLEPARLRAEFRTVVPASLHNDEPPIDLAGAGALMVAGLRELFEEAGVLLARTATGAPVGFADVHSQAIEMAREHVRSGEVPFAQLLQSRDWQADARALALFSHWITPPCEPRRFNTFFFFAAMPQEQSALADAGETHDGIWISPADALARYAAREFHLVYPTIKHLERLCPFESVDAVLAFARRKAILTIMPAVAERFGFEMPPALEDAW
jgi:8-oxo-dGTP pyrophosphatase MutT (NUDIX family)